jgi:hypothetical protein
MTQFYQLTLKDALTQYQAGFLSSAGLLFNYLKITNPVVETANSSVDSPTPIAPTANRVVETATNAPPKPPKLKASSD